MKTKNDGWRGGDTGSKMLNANRDEMTSVQSRKAGKRVLFPLVFFLKNGLGSSPSTCRSRAGFGGAALPCSSRRRSRFSKSSVFLARRSDCQIIRILEFGMHGQQDLAEPWIIQCIDRKFFVDRAENQERTLKGNPAAGRGAAATTRFSFMTRLP